MTRCALARIIAIICLAQMLTDAANHHIGGAIIMFICCVSWVFAAELYAEEDS